MSRGLQGVVPRPAGSPAAVRGLQPLSTYVIDPITRLVAFPDFNAAFPGLMNDALATNSSVGLAVGDVDNMKRYVERERLADDLCFGHLAGNELMAKLGEVALRWFTGSSIDSGCMSTFGGDEIVLLVAGASLDSLDAQVADLARELSAALPCSVSFGYGLFGDGSDPCTLSDTHCRKVLVTVDRALFQLKRERGDSAGPHLVSVGHQAVAADGWSPLAVPREGGMEDHASAAACR